MPKNDTVLTPTPINVKPGRGVLDGIVKLFGNAMLVAGSTVAK